MDSCSLILLTYTLSRLTLSDPSSDGSDSDWRNLDREAFKAALLNGPLCRDVAEMAGRSSEELFSIYEQTARALIDNLLPLRSVRSCRRPLSLWMDREYRDLHREVRCLERRFRCTRSDQDRAAWTRCLRHMYAVLREKEMRYWENLIEQDAGKPRRLWASFSAILGRSTTRRCSTEPSFTATSYLDFMNRKIEAVRRSTESASPPTFHQTDHRMPDLQPFSMDGLRQLLLSSQTKSCELDPLPPFLIKDYLDELLPFLLLLCNTALGDGALPASQKRALVFPSLKRNGLDADDMANYRPISNLSFLSKIAEKYVSMQLIMYLEENSLLPAQQSGFRKHHFTESLLTRILADMFQAVDKGHVTLLALFDVSAAFDTVDHGILLERLKTSFGVVGRPLSWLRAFLRYHDNSSTDISSTTLRLQTFRLQTSRLLLYTSVQNSYTSNFCFSKSLFSSIPTSTYTMIPFIKPTSTDTMIIQHI